MKSVFRGEYNSEYKKLNPAQKEAVDSIDGPVMVVAGPGTGKTQILALRIGKILLKTDVKADAMLCLTFTNAAVEAMKERLVRYIGETGEQVNIFTFHSFGMKIIEAYYPVLGFGSVPKLLDDTDSATLFDEILHNNDWTYLRPRSDSSRYFRDLRSLISLLKRERITPEYFLQEAEKEIKLLELDPDNISSRGESKGELKKEFLNKIEGLKRSREVVKFFNLYEEAKKGKNQENILLDYDDVLENLVKIVETSPDALADIQEKYLYILVDEHQDSNRVQNEFLKIVWGKVGDPNIFVVGDDRQLIYGFSGASIEYFQGFKKTFKGAKLITLVDNYRSTQVILDLSHALLSSVMSDAKLQSQSKEHHPIRLFEADTPEEEIIAAGLDIQKKSKETEGGDGGTRINPNDCAILVPKNKQVRNALEILHSIGLPVSTVEALNLFDQKEAHAFLRILKIIDNGDIPSLALSFFDPISLIEPLEAHKFFAGENMREFSLDSLLEKKSPTLFLPDGRTEKWILKLSKWKKYKKINDLKTLVETVGKDLFENKTEDKKIVSEKEIVDTFLSLLSLQLDKNSKLTLPEFVSYLERLERYGEHVPLSISAKEGIKVLTMHSSKGLEFEYVWIAHMDERSLNSGKKMGFVMPSSIAEKVQERDTDAVKRKLYVAITRAKRFCTLSYALGSEKAGEQEVARAIVDLPAEIFKKQKFSSKKKEAASSDLTLLASLSKLVAEKYSDRYVSVSLLNNFFECPWKWYFRNLLGLPEPKVESLEFGNAVHASVDKVLKMKSAPSLKEIEEIVKIEVLKREFGDERKKIQHTKEISQIVSRWAKDRFPEIAPQHENEKSISTKDDKFPLLNIYGKIDLLEYLNSDKVRVTDFKTGSVRKKSDIEKMDEEGRMSSYLRQLAMYSYLIQKSFKSKIDVQESRLEFLEAKNKKEALYDRAITPKEIELLVKDISDYDSLVKSGEWANRPCNYNSYGKNTECEYCKMAEMYYKIRGWNTK